jgi:3-phosphoshikimate 1-carboxyvinyltransferase
MKVTIEPARVLRGRIQVPGDKSISHRAAMLGAIAEGTTAISNFLWADDCRSTLACLRSLGVEIREQDGAAVVYGRGPGLRPAADILDAGNSGTTVRLLSGILAGQPFATEITGDVSLRARPMERVAEPLRRMGAAVETSPAGGLPLRVRGASLHGITYTLPVASAQVKSAVLLAGLYADGDTIVREPVATRDHTERMLASFGAQVTCRDGTVSVRRSALRAVPVTVPGDLSSAAFFLAAAAALPDSELTVTGVGINPTRTGVLDVLRAMGADVEVHQDDVWGGEPVGTVVLRGRGLRGTTISGALIPRVIDELPVLCVVATAATGVTEITDAAELRAKESDRIGAIAGALKALAGEVEERPDGLTVYGSRLRGGRVAGRGDHRLAMAFAVAGLLAAGPVVIEEAEAIGVSFPGFFQTLDTLRG